MENWTVEWSSGKLELDKEGKEWIISRPESIKKLMLRFPPSCIVEATSLLLAPARGGVAIVTSSTSNLIKNIQKG